MREPVLAADMGSCLLSPNSAVQAQEQHVRVSPVMEIGRGGEDALLHTLGFSASPAACRGFVSLTCVANVQWHLRLDLLLKTVVRLAPMHFGHITLQGHTKHPANLHSPLESP
ncbi:hypothetical protein V8C42DRAFT_93652 [Trichoderma barbatum]